MYKTIFKKNDNKIPTRKKILGKTPQKSPWLSFPCLQCPPTPLHPLPSQLECVHMYIGARGCLDLQAHVPGNPISGILKGNCFGALSESTGVQTYRSVSHPGCHWESPH
jgi:hypothetical protein